MHLLIMLLLILVVVFGVTVTRWTARRVIVARLARYVGVVEVGGGTGHKRDRQLAEGLTRLTSPHCEYHAGAENCTAS